MRRSDALDRVTAEVRYADDVTPEGVLHGAVLYPESAPGILRSLDVQTALEMPGVAGIITAEDIPGSRRIGMVDRDQPALVAVGEAFRSLADPIGAVFADTREAARTARDAIVASIEPVPGVFSAADALADGAPTVAADKPGNIFYEGRLVRGDADAALESAATVVSGTFSTQRIIHGYMEPESGHAEPDGEGGVVIRYPSQTVFDDRDQVAEVLDLPKEKVRVIQLPTGGAFGGKEDLLLQHLLALGALKFGRPVKITLDRSESLTVVQKKHPAEFTARLGLDADGRITALTADIVTDTGAYASLGFDIVENMMAFVGGPYFIPELRINGRSVHTHNVMCGAMRGFGANQGNFVIESLLDMAARETGADPFEIRRTNALKPGLPTVTGHILEPGLPGILPVIDALESAVNQIGGNEVPAAPEGWKPGFGIACGVKNVGFGHGLPESAGARVELDADGTVMLSVTHHEYGQGALIGQARIAARALGLPMDRIEVRMPDTRLTPFTGATTASRQTFLSGNATLAACRNLLSDLCTRGAEQLGLDDPAVLVLDGDALATRDGSRRLPLAELGESFSAEHRAMMPDTVGFSEELMAMPGTGDVGGGDPRAGAAGAGDAAAAPANRRTHWAYAYGAQAAWTAVNPATGEVKVQKIITVSDAGEVLNARAVEGQQEGGVVMGVGYALSEEFPLDEGRPTVKNLAGCGLPRADAAPEIVNIAVEEPHPRGPFGAKGLAEAPSLATAPAIANAVFDAQGVRMTSLPMKKEKVKEALDGSENH